jgi:hypothetical protein
MFEVREPNPRKRTDEDADPRDVALMNEARSEAEIQAEDVKKRHSVLMDILHDEGDRQAEERFQMSIDEDYQDHLHWRPEDAAEVIERGQAPLVFNEGRQTIEWISGTEKRMRKDYWVLPREPGDEAGAALMTKLIKYTDDANLTQWHRSKAFKQMAVCGLSWLEEGINPNPAEEIIYSGWEDWRNVIRDSRSRDIKRRDARFIFRRKKLDLDYAQAMFHYLPDAERIKGLLKGNAYRNAGTADEDEMQSPWYLGVKLTGASELSHNMGRPASSFEERGAFMQSTGYYDSGRRMTTDVVECYYRVPEPVQVFVGGAFDGKLFLEADPRQRWERDRVGTPLRDAVRMRMRVMLATPDFPLWDGPSPFRHQQFNLSPMIAYQRARDGQIYGVWRGMRDLQDDTNKRRSKALWQLSVNQIIVEKDAVDDLDTLREEGARPDGVIVIKGSGKRLEFREHQGDIAANLEMARENALIMRNIGGVTNENLGLNTQAQSGKAILAKQDQGSLTTSDLFDNMQLAIKMAGELRLSHMEQFWTQKKAIRIAGGSRPVEWVVINEYDEETGEWKNDITQREADFIVDTRDYRTTYAQAALEQMFGLLGQIATFAPQVVLNVLDLVVESADLKDKEEWVARIRKLNGQRDPSKEPTPQEQAADMAAAAKQQQTEALMELMAEAELKLKQAQANKAEHESTLALVKGVMDRVATMAAALEVAGIVIAQPHLAQTADVVTTDAGLPGAAPKLNMAQVGAEAEQADAPEQNMAQQPQLPPPDAADPASMPTDAQPAPDVPPVDPEAPPPQGDMQ